MAPTPLWTPNPAHVQTTAMQALIQEVGQSVPEVRDYSSLHRWSVEHYQDFWRQLLETSGILYYGSTRPVVKAERMPGAGFFPQVRLNFAENLLRHRTDACAIASISEARPAVRLTYAELFVEVAR